MSQLTYDDLRELQNRMQSGELSVDDAGCLYTLAELAEALRMTRATEQALVEGWSQDQLWWQPPAAQSETSAQGKDLWSATQAVTHIIATENWYLMHMGRLVGKREQFDVMPRGLGDHAHNDVPKTELAGRLGDATERLLAAIAAIPGDADLTARRDSTFFGELSLRGWVMLAIVHDIDHTAQIQRLTEYDGFPRN